MGWCRHLAFARVPKCARSALRSPPSASTSKRKKVALRPPGQDSRRFVLRSQADLDFVLGNLDAKGSLLVDEASEVCVRHFADLEDGGSYALEPQARKVWGRELQGSLGVCTL